MIGDFTSWVAHTARHRPRCQPHTCQLFSPLLGFCDFIHDDALLFCPSFAILRYGVEDMHMIVGWHVDPNVV